MAPSSEYHKRSHSRSEVLRFSCALKNASSVYYRRYTISMNNRIFENDSGSFCSRSQRRLSCLLSAPLRSNGADYVLLLFIYFIYLFFKFFYSPFVLRNYPTDSHQIFRNCVFWCSLNNPVVLKFFRRHLAEKNTKNSENLVKISRVDWIFDDNFKTVKDNSNLKQT